MNLLPRLYSPNSGRITWDGVDLESTSLASLRQDRARPSGCTLLATTVYENIRFGLDGVTEADVQQAAELAHAHDFIVDLPDGYDTAVGERGAGLSGGQRRRILPISPPGGERRPVCPARRRSGRSACCRKRPGPRSSLRGGFARVALFAALTPQALDGLTRLMVRIERRSGEPIYVQGTVSDAIFIVGRGRVEAGQL